MADALYPPGEDLAFDPQPKRETISFAQPVRHGSHQPQMERRASCISPAELDSKSRNPTRRRIQVACNRCRKRKIKCSGDTGDGQGCSNCRSSGNTDCHFLRVNSSVLQTKSGWPYPAVTGTAPPHRIGMYTSKRSGIHANQNFRAASFSRPDYDGLFDQNVLERPPFSIEQGIGYQDDSAYQPGCITSSGPPDYLGIWNQKIWNPKQNGAIFSDQDESSLTQSTSSYMIPTSTLSAEITPVAATMILPSDGNQTGRTLPNPASRQVPSSMSAVSSMPDAIPTISFTQDFRSGNPWAPRTLASNPRTLVSMPNGPFAVPMSQAKIHSSATVQDMAFGYLPISSTTTDATPTIPSSTATISGMEPADVGDVDQRLSRSFSRDNGRLLGIRDCSPEIYGYSTSDKKKRRTSYSEAGDSDSGMLLNGLRYTRSQHPEMNSGTPFNLLATDPIPEYRPPVEVQRTISPLGSNGF